MKLNIRSFLKQLIPAQPCLLCGAMSNDGVWCATCDHNLPRMGNNLCPQCALPSATAALCGQCLQHPPSFQHTVATFAYTFPVDRLIQAMKFAEHLQLVAPLADTLLPRIQHKPDALVAMPMHPARLRARGFNQSHLLARHLAKRLRLPLLEGCQRVRDTPPQSSLALDARHQNLRQAFACDRQLTDMHIAIVDDVMTTGASMEALASTLRQAGAHEVSAWVIARTPPRNI